MVQNLFLNRELSWIEFNNRVLYQAIDKRTPLLERVRFLGIFNSNLDEFYMKRVGGLKRQVLAQVSSPLSQLANIRKAILPLLETKSKCFNETIRPELEKEGIFFLTWNQLNEKEREEGTRFFEKNIFPVLTPLAVDPGHPFPFISNLSISLGIVLKRPGGDDDTLFARVKIPDVFPSWIQLEPQKFRFISLIELIQQNLPSLFPGMEVLEVMAFRISRNADIERDEEDADDLLEMIAEELRERRFAQVVRLEHGPTPQKKILQLLMEELDLTEADIYQLPDPLEFSNLSPIADLKLPQFKFNTWIPQPPPALLDEEVDIFSIIRKDDLLVHHPYESFTHSVERFIKSASEDPKVLGIKMVLYRTGQDSPFIPYLIRAAEAGKQVVCLVELKARFDEEKNILVAQALEKSGVHVVYGVVGLKTHCKISLVVRQEAEGVKCYAHIGTGNYHSQTARVYTDLGLFTSKTEITDDIVHLFHYLTGLSLYQSYRKLILAPLKMKDFFLQLIRIETENAKKGLPAQIIAKMNSLEEEDICQALFEASQAGVEIDLIVRGVCTLRPQLPSMSERIRVISVIGRFLEHSRIFYFRSGMKDPLQGLFYIGSADWMHRNLSSRVEAIVPIEDKSLKLRCYEILQIMLTDQRQAWDMQSDGTYILRQPNDPLQDQGTQNTLMNLTRARNSVAPH